MTDSGEGGGRSLVFLTALRTALGRTSVWLVCTFVTVVLAAAAALPWVGAVDQAVSHNFEPGSLLGTLDETFRFDHRAELGQLRDATARGGAVLALLAILFGAFSAGGWLQVFLERTAGHSVRRFLWGGSRYFWRFFRVLLMTLLLLHAVGWLTHAWPWEKLVLGLLLGIPDGDLEALASERSAFLVRAVQALLHAALVGVVFVWGDYTRTRLALHGARSSVWAGLCTIGLVLRHPVAVIRPLLLILGVELLLVTVIIGSFSWGLNEGFAADSTGGDLVLLWLVGVFALAIRWITRGARYHAAVQVSRKLVQPLMQVDPWGSRVGGPGGPQYPIDDADEYSVSM
jgi:hypothetical protein